MVWVWFKLHPHLHRMINQLKIADDTVDGRNPAPVEVGSFSHYFPRFFSSQVVQDFFQQQQGDCLWFIQICKALCVSFLNKISCQSETTWAVMLLESKSSHPTHGGRRSFPFGFRPNFQGILQLVSGRVNIGLFVKIVIFTCRIFSWTWPSQHESRPRRYQVPEHSLFAPEKELF